MTGRRLRPQDLSNLLSCHYPLIVATLVAVITLSVTQASHQNPPSVHDALGYVQAAQRLVTTGTFAFGAAEEGPNAVVTPGYPLVLAAAYGLVPRGQSASEWANAARPLVTLLQQLMVLGIVACMTYAGQLLGGRRMALVAGILTAIYAPFGFAASVQLSDLLGALLVAGSLLVSLMITSSRTMPRTAHFVALGLLSGAIGLVRPVYTLWALFPLVYLVVTRSLPVRELGRKLLLFLLAASLVMAPWWIRNVVTLRQFVVFNTNAGVTMLDATGTRELSPSEQSIAAAAEAQGRDRASAVAWSRIRAMWNTSPSAFLASKNANAWRAMSSPANAVVDAAWEDANHYDVERIDYGEFSGKASPLFLWLFHTTTNYHLLLLAGALAGLLFVRRAPQLLLPASLPVYSVAIHYLTVFNDRYFMPAMSGVILLAAAGAVGLFLTAQRLLKPRQAPKKRSAAAGRRHRAS